MSKDLPKGFTLNNHNHITWTTKASALSPVPYLLLYVLLEVVLFLAFHSCGREILSSASLLIALSVFGVYAGKETLAGIPVYYWLTDTEIHREVSPEVYRNTRRMLLFNRGIAYFNQTPAVTDQLPEPLTLLLSEIHTVQCDDEQLCISLTAQDTMVIRHLSHDQYLWLREYFLSITENR